MWGHTNDPSPGLFIDAIADSKRNKSSEFIVTHHARANMWSLFSCMWSVVASILFFRQKYGRTPWVKIMTTYSAVAWWVKTQETFGRIKHLNAVMQKIYANDKIKEYAFRINLIRGFTFGVSSGSMLGKKLVHFRIFC